MNQATECVTIAATDHQRRRRGQALVEFSLLLPVILLVGLGVADFARVFYFGIVVTNAARAGAQHGIRGGYANPQTIRDAAAADANLGTRFQANTTNVPEASCFMRCPGSEGELAGGCTVANLSSCGTEQAYVYVRVRTSYTFTTIVNYPGIPHQVNLSGLSIMRER